MRYRNKSSSFPTQIAGLVLFIVLISAGEVRALERWVVPNTSQCSSDTDTHPCYTTLKDASDNSVGGDSIRILPGTYPANITIATKNITIFGVETARTFIDGGGNAAIIVSGVSTPLMTISNLTFINSALAISVTSTSTQVTIKNNVFLSTTTGIQSDATSSPIILNNTFYQNGTAILSSQNNLTIVNNIFFGNNLSISANVSLTNIQYNLFNPENTAGPPNIIFNSPDTTDPDNKFNISGDPSFVNPSAGDITQRDFHLKSDTACKQKGTASFGISANSINGGNPPDIGAYGGGASDTVPYPISLTPGTLTETSPGPPKLFSLSLSWSSNSSYFTLGYSVYYSLNQSGPPYQFTRQNTPALDVGTLTSTTLTDLSAATAPTAPLLTSVDFANETLKLSWTPILGATGYIIYYIDNDAGPGPEQSMDVGNVTSFDLTGLINLHQYSLAVTAVTQNTYYIAVTNYDNTTQTRTPGEQYESTYSVEQRVPVGQPAESTKMYDPNTYFPEPVTPNPNLLNKGCFIATAAYGYYSAPQVQALREFRDRYLTTNTPGRAFVRWYYTYGPVGAQFINEHPWLKPFVRTALMPAVAGAMFMTRTSIFTKTIVFMFIGLLAIIRLRPLQKKDMHHENI